MTTLHGAEGNRQCAIRLLYLIETIELLAFKIIELASSF